MTIKPAKGMMRTAGAALNIVANQGYVHDVLLKDTYRGFVHNSNAAANDWHYRNIWQQTSSGVSGALMIFGGGYPISDIEVDNVVGLGQGATYNELQLIIGNGNGHSKNFELGRGIFSYDAANTTVYFDPQQRECDASRALDPFP